MTPSALKIEGRLLSRELLQKQATAAVLENEQKSYGIPRGLSAAEEITRAYKIARQIYKDAGDNAPNAAAMEGFLRDALGFADLQRQTPPPQPRQGQPADFAPSHFAGKGKVCVVVPPQAEGLDKRQAGFWAGARKIAPFRLLQICLENQGESAWGLATDGKTLRLARSSAALTKNEYVEFDIARIVGEGDFAGFHLLWACAHFSRFVAAGGGDCPLEQWRRKGIETGDRARVKLRAGVKTALVALGSGFLQHEKNGDLRERLQNAGDTKAINQFHRQLLWLAYRLIFLLAVESRGGFFGGKRNGKDARLAYEGGYGLSRLRERCASPHSNDKHEDLWIGLRFVFEALGKPRGEIRVAHPLGLPELGGLFALPRCKWLQNAALANKDFIRAMHYLCYWRDNNGALRKTDYYNMDAEELGSVYESLLELVPYVKFGNEFLLTEVEGNARKTSGSYYTPTQLVQQMLKTTLQPKLDSIQTEEQLLALRVIDPACGSGHFLLGAARKMADRLLELRAEAGEAEEGNDEEEQNRRQEAMRSVISSCICGVDKNPMSLDLAKTALWLESFDKTKPLVFLDHHLQQGDSLLGVYNMDLPKRGVPDAAYKPATGDSKPYCALLKQSNKREREKPPYLQSSTSAQNLQKKAEAIAEMPEANLLQIGKKQKKLADLEKNRAITGEQMAADLYVAAFLSAKTQGAPVPTSGDVFAALQGGRVKDDIVAVTQKIVRQATPFHWRLRYPDIFAKGGFDVVLGNPPWERLKLSEQEFFAAREPEIAEALNQAARRRLIAKLGEKENDSVGKALKREFEEAKRLAANSSQYINSGGNFPLTAMGDLNTYPLFAELFMNLAENGTSGAIVPTNIATDYSTQTFFKRLIEGKKLASLLDFENRQKLFAEVHRSYRFALLTMANSEQANFVAFAHNVNDLAEPERNVILAAENLRLVNPNTMTMPLYRAKVDRDLCEKIYRAAPVLWKDATENEEEVNPWQTKFSRMFDISGDSRYFLENESEGAVRFYQGSMIHQYDHRWGTYERGNARDSTLPEKKNANFVASPKYWIKETLMLTRVALVPADLQRAALQNEDAFRAVACSWIVGCALSHDMESASVEEFFGFSVNINLKQAEKYAAECPLSVEEIKNLARLISESTNNFLRARSPNWLMGYRAITNSTNEWTTIFSIVPLSAVGNTIPLLYSNEPADKRAVLCAILNSFVVNYAARQKLGGTGLLYFYLKQLPVFGPSQINEADLMEIVPRVLELSYTAVDLRPFYDDIVAINPNYDPRPASERGKPFAWNEYRRAQLRAEVEARIAKKYGITEAELIYIFDPKEAKGKNYPSETFRVLQERETKKFGEYRSRNLTLAAFLALP